MSQQINNLGPQMYTPATMNLGITSALNSGLISNASDVGAVQGPDGDKFANMSVEQLLLYCQAQLHTIDTDLSLRMSNQQKVTNRKAALNEAKSALEGYEEPTVENARAAAQSMREAAEKLPPGDPVRVKIEQEAAKIERIAKEAADKAISENKDANPAEAKVNNVTWEQTKSELQNSIDTLRDQAEMRMMQLQSLVGKRQTMVQLTTNLIAKFDQQIQMVSSNIKG